ncbi:MAG TPA: hypothetical protein VN706_01105 [Gemmatimonadaceae bacterium]|nr:hypothetical protein [Gemmatimonadaceae bacterium]
MFRNLVANVGGGVNNANTVLTGYTPLQLANYLELTWNAPRSRARVWRLPAVQGGGAVGRLGVSRRMARNVAEMWAPRPPINPALIGAPTFWSHLIYAYMIENTGIVEIFRRVLQSWISDEKLPPPSIETQYWIRASEDLFFKNPSPYFHSLASSLRPDPDSIRVNAYKRLLGVELGHNFTGNGTGRAPAIANTEFMMVFERLLHEVWNGYVYRAPAAGPNAADVQAMEYLCRTLRCMMLDRRTNGALMREEFEAVSLLSWFHLAVEYDTFIVDNLDAQSTRAASRLHRIGALVGVTPAAASDAYFQLADALSTALISIESGLVELALQANVPALSDPAVSPLANVFQTIITYWPLMTGRALKAPLATGWAVPVQFLGGSGGSINVRGELPAPTDATAAAPSNVYAIQQPTGAAAPAPAKAAAAPAPATVNGPPAQRIVKLIAENRSSSFVGINRVARTETTTQLIS